MHVNVVVPVRSFLLLAALVAGVIGLLWWGGGPATSQEEPNPDPAGPLATFAFLARADNPVDALAAGALAGQLGGPVLLSGTDTLDSEAAAGLMAADPQVVVLAGGTAALSDQVEADVVALLPEAQVRRVAGAGRTETARLLNTLPAELGVGRPVLTDTTITGDVELDGTLTVAGQDIAATLSALTDRLDSLEATNEALESDLDAAITRIDSLESELAAADGRLSSVEGTLSGVSRAGDVLTFAGMNVQLVNGAGGTATTNGLGNLIIGYNEDHTDNGCQPSTDDCQYNGDNLADERTGSHMLVVGVDHSWTSYGGILAGLNNRTSGRFASVTGGQGNTASGATASVAGGVFNTASGSRAAVAGGRSNRALASWSAIAGGRNGTINDTLANEYDSLIGNEPFPDS